MIPRYTRPEMGRIWSDENRFRTWLAVEVAATETLAEAGMVPKEAARAIRERADFSVERIHEIEAEVRHDVIAFTTAVAEIVGPHARWFHYGLTSNDVVDTAQALLIKQASALIAQDLRTPGRGARTPCLGIQRHADGGAHARNSCRAHHVRLQDRQLVFGDAAQHCSLRSGR